MVHYASEILGAAQSRSEPKYSWQKLGIARYSSDMVKELGEAWKSLVHLGAGHRLPVQLNGGRYSLKWVGTSQICSVQLREYWYSSVHLKDGRYISDNHGTARYSSEQMGTVWYISERQDFGQ